MSGPPSGPTALVGTSLSQNVLDIRSLRLPEPFNKHAPQPFRVRMGGPWVKLNQEYKEYRHAPSEVRRKELRTSRIPKETPHHVHEEEEDVDKASSRQLSSLAGPSRGPSPEPNKLRLPEPRRKIGSNLLRQDHIRDAVRASLACTAGITMIAPAPVMTARA